MPHKERRRFNKKCDAGFQSVTDQKCALSAFDAGVGDGN
jgi:hypothetical protein